MTSALLINEPPLQVLPSLAQEFGLNEALVLQQIHYWLKLPFSRQLIDNHYWVRYSPEQWERQFAFWDQKTLRRAIRSLENQGILSFRQAEYPSNTIYYTIDYWLLDKLTSITTSKLERLSIRPTYDHANLDAINLHNKMGDKK